MQNVKSPWAWVPTLYFAEGVPYFIVNTISIILLKRLGLPNTSVALATSLLYLPWVVKPFWSPFVDALRTRRWWVLAMQLMLGVFILCAGLTLPGRTSQDVSAFGFTLALFWLSAFASATHDIAADGFYMLALPSSGQSLFVGIRSTFYRLASIFGQGVLVVLAGWLETTLGNVPLAWKTTLCISAAVFFLLYLHHVLFLPRPESDKSMDRGRASDVLRAFIRSFSSFFRKKGIWPALLFLMLYRLPEALLVKMVGPFLLDPLSSGGLGLSTGAVGLVYGTFGVAGLTLGGIFGGVYVWKHGLKASMWPMALAITVPDLVYVLLGLMAASSGGAMYAAGLMCPVLKPAFVSALVFVEQLGYGFGFSAYMLYMIYMAEGEFSTSHYSICTAFMALGMMLPGLVAGALQSALGYTVFFLLVMLLCLVTLSVTALVRPSIDPQYGKK